LAVLGALLVQCSDDPTAPDKFVPSGYPVYFYDNGDNPKWYIYYPEDNYFDSAYWPISDAYTAAISPHGDRIYIDRGYDCDLAILDVASGTRMPELTDICGGLWIQFSPDDEKMLAAGYQLRIMNYEDHQQLLVDSTPDLSFPRYSADGNLIYGAEGVDRKYFYSTYRADDLTLVSRDSITSNGHLFWGGKTYASDDLGTWYILTMTLGYGYLFVEWDRELDSILFVDSIPSAYPDPIIIRSEDQRYLAYNNPGTMWDSIQNRPNEIRLYDTESGDMADIIDTRYVSGTGDTTYYPVVEMAMTPDSKYLIGISHGGDDVFLVYNLLTLSIERWVELPGHHGFGTLLCQSKP
jgi:hypothetical protein